MYMPYLKKLFEFIKNLDTYVKVILVLSLILIFASIYNLVTPTFYFNHFKNRIKVRIYGGEKKVFISALNYYQNHKNDWIICTDLGLNTFNENKLQTMAYRLVYYKYGHVYCKKFWYWEKSKCSFLRGLNEEAISKHALNKLALCELSSDFFENRKIQHNPK